MYVHILLYLSTECIKTITNCNTISSTIITTSNVTITTSSIAHTTNTTVTTAGIVTSSLVDVTTPTTVQIASSQKNSAGVYIHMCMEKIMHKCIMQLLMYSIPYIRMYIYVCM